MTIMSSESYLSDMTHSDGSPSIFSLKVTPNDFSMTQNLIYK